MDKFTAIEPIWHDGERYAPGDTIELTEGAAAPLLALGAVAPARKGKAKPAASKAEAAAAAAAEQAEAAAAAAAEQAEAAAAAEPDAPAERD